MIADFYPVQVGWRDEVSTFEIKIECPKTLKGCSSENIFKRGHDTKVKGQPQHYECTDCQSLSVQETSPLLDYNIADGDDILLIPASTAG